MAAAIARTASATAGESRSGPAEIAPTLRTYCNDAAATSSGVAGGSSPRNMVMFLHTAPRYATSKQEFRRGFSSVQRRLEGRLPCSAARSPYSLPRVAQ